MAKISSIKLIIVSHHQWNFLMTIFSQTTYSNYTLYVHATHMYVLLLTQAQDFMFYNIFCFLAYCYIHIKCCQGSFWLHKWTRSIGSWIMICVRSQQIYSQHIFTTHVSEIFICSQFISVIIHLFQMKDCFFH